MFLLHFSGPAAQPLPKQFAVWTEKQHQTQHNFAAFCKVAVHLMRAGSEAVQCCSSLIYKSHSEGQSNLENKHD